MVSQGIALVGYASLWFLFVPGKPWMFIFSLPFHSFGIGSLFVLMMSMTADVIDLDELNYGVRREGVFGAIYWYMVKFGFAIAGGLSGVILTLVGFDGNAAVQPEGAVDGLRMFFSGLPMLGTLAAMYLMHDYDVDEERANQIRAELNARKTGKTEVIIPLYQSQTSLVVAQREALKTDIDLTAHSPAEVKSLFNGILGSGLHGICFSPYLEGQQIGDPLSEEQIYRRMEIIAPHTEWVRSFSCTGGNELIPKAARKFGLKTMTGAWVDANKEMNLREIKSLVTLAKDGLVDIAVIGNEVLMRGDLTLEELIAYIHQVKKEIPHVPVAYVDTYNQFLSHPQLIEACDVILVNCYPFWEGIHISNASSHLSNMYELVKNASNGKKVIITETGWPDKGTALHAAEPSVENAVHYFINAQRWAKESQVELFYFSSFDESWKVRQEGDVGQSWGLWNKHEQLKY